MKTIMEDKFGFPKELSEEVNEYGMPFIVENKKEDKKEVDYKSCLDELMAAVDLHQAIMAGQGEEGDVDPLPETLQKIKDKLNPPEDKPEGDKPEEKPAEGPEEKPVESY